MSAVLVGVCSAECGWRWVMAELRVAGEWIGWAVCFEVCGLAYMCALTGLCSVGSV